MIPLFATILCSTSIGLLLKYNDSRQGHPLVLLAGNYLVASLVGLGLLVFNGGTFSWITLGFGAFLALFFVVSFFAFTQAVKAAGTALAAVSSRLSVVVPVALSVAAFGEQPGALQLAGFLFGGITLTLFYFSLRNHEHHDIHFRDYLFLLILFLGIGLGDFSMKCFQQLRPSSDKPLFIFAIFFFSFFYTFGAVLIKKSAIERKTLVRGAILGVPNVFSSFFLISALSRLPAFLVYPVVNIGVILLTAVAAWFIWRERMNRYGVAALLTGTISIILLSL